MPRIGMRDWDYVEARLLAPFGEHGADEAHGRLRQAGFFDEANQLMEAMKKFNDECRRIRTLVGDHNRNARP